MVNQIWISQAVLAFITAVSAGTEFLPERYLKPQDFNHHPFTDVGLPAALKKAASNPYAILSKKRPREGREFPPQNVIIYPTPHPSVISRKQIETNEISKYIDPYVSIPKNYAFSYTVKDQYSGDDFSHSQAHNGKATRGQYRVKLPDGRTQIVNYTADHKGYRADVQYEDELVSKPLRKILYRPVQNILQTPVELPEIYQKYHASVTPKPISTSDEAKIVYAVTPDYKSDVNYVSSSSTASPARYVPDGGTLQLVVKSTPAPGYYETNYVHSTPATYIQKQYVSPEHSEQHVQQQYVSSTPLYAVSHAPTTAAPPSYQQEYQNYPHVSSTISPQHAVIVTPRPPYNQALGKSGHQQSTVLYRLV